MKTKSDKVITVVTIDRHAYQQKVMEVLYKKNSFPKYKRIQWMFIKNKYNSNTLYTVTWDAAWAVQITLDHVLSNMFVHASREIETTGP